MMRKPKRVAPGGKEEALAKDVIARVERQAAKLKAEAESLGLASTEGYFIDKDGKVVSLGEDD